MTFIGITGQSGRLERKSSVRVRHSAAVPYCRVFDQNCDNRRILLCFRFAQSGLRLRTTASSGVVVLLSAYSRSARLCIRTGRSTLLLAGFFRHYGRPDRMLTNLAGPVGRIVHQCCCDCPAHSVQLPRTKNVQSVTLVLGYLLLYGYDVSGHAYQMRLFGLAVGALRTWYSTATIAAMPMSSVETSFLLSICAIRAQM